LKTPVSEHAPFRLGEWRIDPLAHTIVHVDAESQLPPKVMAVLVYLAHNHHRLVTREELIEEIWDGNAYVGSKALTNAIWQIRHAFGDSQDLVKTVPKTGYQLLTVPEFEGPDSSDPVRKRLSPWFVLAAAVLILFSVLSGYQWLTGGDQPEVELELLVGMPGRELYPAASPDGRWIAFQSVSLQGQRDIYLKNMTSPERDLQQLTFTGSYEISPAWSGDGRRLAFIREDRANGNCSIVVRDMASQEESIFSRCVASEYDFDTLSWSPDGQWLVFRYAFSGQEPGLYLWPARRQDSNSSETKPTRISCLDCDLVDQEVSWSPDSSKLAVTRRKNRLSTDVYLYHLENQVFEKLTSDERSIKGHAWYKDNRTLLYVANRGPNERQLRAIDTRSGKNRNLGIDNAGFPIFLPGYDQIAFYQRVTDTHISSIQLQQDEGLTSVPAPVIQTAHTERSPAVDRLSNRIAYISDASGYEEIWISEFDGTDSKQLTDLQRSLEDPAWSPDGRTIVFISVEPSEGADHLQLLDVETGQIETLHIGLEDYGPPSWSADGLSLIVPVREQGVFNLWRITVDSGQMERLTNDGGEFGREDLKGEFVYFTKSDEPGFFRMDKTGESILISRDWDSGYGWANWDWISEDELVFSKVQGEQIVVSRIRLSDKAPSPIYALPLRTIHRLGHLSYSPQNDSVVFTNRELPQIDIWVTQNPLE
jgi:Tol biopolymer transport system component/DNA-binding winged helix-turn-helix (wHTH) protein